MTRHRATSCEQLPFYLCERCVHYDASIQQIVTGTDFDFPDTSLHRKLP